MQLPQPLRRRRLAAVAAVLSVGALARAALLLIRIDGASMRPTYEPGDLVVALRRHALRRPLAVGDVVVVRAPAPGWRAADDLAGAQLHLVKRVTARPGAEGDESPLVDGRLWVQGDGANSYDSRRFGPLPPDALLGRVIWRMPYRVR